MPGSFGFHLFLQSLASILKDGLWFIMISNAVFDEFLRTFFCLQFIFINELLFVSIGLILVLAVWFWQSELLRIKNSMGRPLGVFFASVPASPPQYY
jgi:hypothetical protein